jgi:hypothetical protein
MLFRTCPTGSVPFSSSTTMLMCSREPKQTCSHSCFNLPLSYLAGSPLFCALFGGFVYCSRWQPLLASRDFRIPARRHENVEKAGTIWRQSTLLRVWKQTYVVITKESLMFWYSSETDSAPEDVIALKKVMFAAAWHSWQMQSASKSCKECVASACVHSSMYVCVCGGI